MFVVLECSNDSWKDRKETGTVNDTFVVLYDLFMVENAPYGTPDIYLEMFC